MHPVTWSTNRRSRGETWRRLGAASLTALLLAGILPLSPVRAAPTLGAQLYATGELISIEVLPATAALTSTLFLLEPEEVRIATNRDVGLTVEIGPYGSGEELIFGIRVNGQEYRMGPAERNPDGIVHAGVDFLADGCAIVGFEDLFGGGDRDYDDNRFRFCGGIAEEPPDPDPDPEEPPFVGPTADAGDDQAVDEGSVVTLDATRSTASNLLSRTWTTTPDFTEGTSINLTDIPPDQLRLDDTTEAFNFIWIAASARGTVVKIDTTTGEVLGEYWSAPQNRGKDPSRTTVDHAGNVWVGNRAESTAVGGVVRGSVTQIGLAENGQCVDRNANGTIETSTGLGDIKGWPNASGADNDGGVETAVDECIIRYVRTNGVAIRQVSVDAENHVWVGGAALGGSPNFFDRLAPDGSIVRSINMRLPAQTGESGVVACCYGGLVDPNGILWSSADNNNYLVRIDPSRPNGDADLMRVIPLGRTSYGLGIDPDGNLWQSNWVFNSVQKITPAGAIVNTYPTGGASNDRGVVATADGDIWVANSGGNTVSRLGSDGAVKAIITVGQQPTGVAVDAAGRVWASNLSSSTASRIDPATNAVDLTVSLGAGAAPYNYSDMTGSTLTGAPDEGTWSVVHDSGSADTSWAFVDWTASVAGDGNLAVSVASSADGVTFGPEVTVADGQPIDGLDDGRYLRLTVRFTRSTAGDSPVLFDLSAAYEGDRAASLAYQWRLVGVDGPPVFLSSTTSPTPSFVAPDDATYTFELTVTDSAGLTDTDEVTVVVDNLDPAVEAEIGSAFARAVTLVNASLTDPGWLDTHSATFDWGDGSPVQAVAVTAQGTGWGTFFGSHIYPDAGSYEVSVTLTDDDGGTDAVSLGQVSVAEPVAVWANSTSAKKGLDWSGGGGTIEGRVHSNRDLRVVGTEPKTIDGPAEYVRTITISGPHDVTPVQSTVQPFPVTYNVADYAPNGPVARQVGAQYFDHASQCVKGLWDVGSSTLPVGVHYAPCSVKLNGSSISGQITIAVTGTIELSGSRPAFEPFHDGVLLIAGSAADKAINVSASDSKFLGVLYAGSGEISLSGAGNRFFCAIYGDRVDMAGFDLSVRGASCGRPDSTVSGPLLVPDLQLTLAADPQEILPGGDIDYDLAVANDGSLLVVPGLLGLENVDTASATVTGVSYALEYFSIVNSTWEPIASLANGRLALTASANAAAGVTYPAPDGIIGTTIGAGGFATWGYQALVDLTPAEVELLLDPALVGGFRNRVDFTLTPSTVQVRRLFTFGTDFVGALRALSGDITDPQLTFLPPAGDLVTENAGTNPALAILSPGEEVVLPEAFTVPVPAPRSPLETDAGYLTRLLALDGTALVGSSFALAQGGVGMLVAPLATASTTERLPVVSISTVGPDGVPAGTSAEYELRLANLGSSGAGDVDVAATASDEPLTVAGAPAALAAGELTTATTTYAAPANDPPADVEIAGQVTWSDAAGNAYGPVGSARTVAILTPATMTATLVDALQVDDGGDGNVSPGDTIRYTFAITNHGDLPLTNAVASVAPDANSALRAGSVAGDGTVVEGNGAGDAAVEVAFATIPGHTTVTFTFDAVVDDPFPTGTSHLFVQGQVTADGVDPIVTDDPALPGQAGTTRTAVVVPVPNLTAFLEAALHLDPDGNGFPSAGDTIRYSLVVNSVGSLDVSGVGVTVANPTGASLVPGSVTTSVGSVVSGPSVAVTIGSLPSFTSATISFDLQVTSPLPAGVTAVSVQGTVVSTELPDLATDDPDTFAVGDPTVTGLGSAGGGGGGTPGVPGPTIDEVSLAEGTVLTEPVEVNATLTPVAGESITGWSVGYRLEGGTTRIEIAAGTGSDVAATIDPTVMPNGAYVIDIRATGSGGGESVNETGVVVEGDLKLGRFQITYQDLYVPVAGIPIQVLRTYDSFDKGIGDFGIGWTVDIANFRAATNGPLGQGGWTMFGCGGGLIFVPLCFESTAPHYVAVTWPDGRVEIFDLTPAPGSTFLSGLTSAVFTGRPGTTSKLEALDSGLYFSNGNLLGGFFGSEGIYDPTHFRLTDKGGMSYVLEVGRGLLSASDRNGNTVTISDSGILSSLGPSVTFQRDPQGRITRITGPSGEFHTYAYLPSGDLGSATDATSHTVEYHYDPHHNLTQIDNANGTPFRTITYEDGRIASITDGEGNTTQVDIDVDGREQVITSPSGRLTTVTTYDERGNAERIDQAFSGQTRTERFEYDDLGRVTKRIDPLLHESTLTYNADGLVATATDALERTTRLQYENGLLVEVEGPDGFAELTIEPDALGNPAVVDRGLGARSEWTFNGDGKPLTGTNPLDKSYTASYDPTSGDLADVEDPLGNAVGVTWNASDKPLTITTPTSTSTFTYDGNGNIRTMEDGRGGTWTFTYDEQHRLLTEEDPRGEVRTRAYDDAGRLISVLDRNGQLTEYRYDVDGFLDEVELPDGTIIEQEYDGLGRLTAAENAISRVEMTYDPTNLVTHVETTPVNGSGVPASSVAYTYDEVGRRATMTTADGVTEYRYDDFDRLREIEEPDGDVVTLNFDRIGRLDRLERPNGLDSDWDWNLASQPTSIEHELGGSAIDRLTYEYGESGLLDRLIDSDGAHLFGYDDTGQVTSVDHPSGRADEAYGYDAAGNRTTAASTYDAGNRLTGNATHTFTWDDEGRLATRTNRTTGVVDAYAWDAEGRLQSVTTDGSTTTFGYDPFGRRIKIAGPAGTRYLAFGVDENAYAEFDAAGAVSATYLFGNQIDSPIAMSRGGSTYYFLQDAGGNITGLANDSGAIVSRYAYDAFGTLASSSGSVANPYTFAGREYEPAAAAYYFRLRWYDPGTGRFLSEDPIPSPNLYPFANNNPLTFADPMGTQALIEYKATTGRTGAQAATRQRFIYRFYDCGDEAAGRAAGWYYGMTNNAVRRQAEHGTRIFGDTFELLVEGPMQWMMTRAIEQVFINAAGGVGNLANIINSMSPTNPRNAPWMNQANSWFTKNFLPNMPPGFNFNPASPGGC